SPSWLRTSKTQSSRRACAGTSTTLTFPPSAASSREASSTWRSWRLSDGLTNGGRWRWTVATRRRGPAQGDRSRPPGSPDRNRFGADLPTPEAQLDLDQQIKAARVLSQNGLGHVSCRTMPQCRRGNPPGLNDSCVRDRNALRLKAVRFP